MYIKKGLCDVQLTPCTQPTQAQISQCPFPNFRLIMIKRFH